MADEAVKTTTTSLAEPGPDLADGAAAASLPPAPAASLTDVRWREVFPFTHLFRAFRVAVHPSKLLLSLVALLLLYLGGHVLDLVWPVRDRAVPAEVATYERFVAHELPGQTFASVRAAVRGQTEEKYARRLLDENVVASRAAADDEARHGGRLSDLRNHLLVRRQAAVNDADKARDEAVAAAEAAYKAAPKGDARFQQEAERGRREARRAANDLYAATVRRAFDSASAEYAADGRIDGRGLFDAFFEYEANQVSNVVRGVQSWNWIGDDRGEPPMAADGTNPLGADADGAGTALRMAAAAAQAQGTPLEGIAAALTPPSAPAVFPSVVRFLAVGPMWLLTQHGVYFFLFGVWFLVLWSVFGGAVSRIAAVHVARDEKLSIRSAVAFSAGKFLSFLCAPLIPLVVLLLAGAVVTVGSLLGNVPWVGPVVLGVAFPLALLAGGLMALILLGLVGGLNLMYPTIAAEGSDSFDAISRSFSYVYVRPWRLAFYTLVALVYGAVTYLFVRLFLWLLLAMTHRFVGFGMFRSAESTAPLWPTLWPSPTAAARLSYDIDSLGLTFGQEVGARLIWLWVHLIIALLGAFAVSFYFSANTIIYFLMRREVDATDMNDVYLEQVDDEYADPVPDAGEAATAPAPSAAPPATAAAAEPRDEVSPPT